MNSSNCKRWALGLAGALLWLACGVTAASSGAAGKATAAPRGSGCVAPPTLPGAGPRRDCASTPELMAIPAGEFQMGDQLGNGYAYEKPVHAVKVPAFLIGRSEVTVGEWRACVAAGGCPDPGLSTVDARLPVTSVSWDDVQLYLAWLSRVTGRPYRLPSEAEWEYAARAGVDTQFPWGNIEIAICQHANTLDLSGAEANPSWTWAADCDDGHAGLAPVGSYPANAWGLHDMIGNVWEWVADCWHSNYDGAPATAEPWLDGSCNKRVNRGGGWGNHARTARIATRDGDVHSGHSDGLGFRVARNMIYAAPAAKSAKPALPAP